jgi:hypothetical protein
MYSIYDDSTPLNYEDSTNIRVIEMLDRYQSPPGAYITCKFQVVSLNSNPAYTALSYTWGPPDSDKVITIGGEIVMVRKNLWEFLAEALERVDNRPRWLWIDAICIDQSNNTEKSHQVAMMGDIYSKAAHVLVWLGPATKAITHTFNKMMQYDENEFHVPNVNYWDPMVGHGIEELKALEYWHRLWILQEFLLAGRIEIWCGSYKFDDIELTWLLKQEVTISCKYESPPMKILQCRSNRLASSVRYTLPDLIDRFGLHMKCENALDGIYAFLSLLDEEERRSLNIQPDYSKTAVALWEELIPKFIDLRDEIMGPSSLEDNLNNLAVVLGLNDVVSMITSSNIGSTYSALQGGSERKTLRHRASEFKTMFLRKAKWLSQKLLKF